MKGQPISVPESEQASAVLKAAQVMMMCILVKIQWSSASRLLGMAHMPSMILPLLSSPASLPTPIPTSPYATVIPRCLTPPIHPARSPFPVPAPTAPASYLEHSSFLPWFLGANSSLTSSGVTSQQKWGLSLRGPHWTSCIHLQHQHITLSQCLSSHDRSGASFHIEYSGHNVYN